MDATLDRAKALAKERLSELDGVLGFGIGDGTVRIYVQREDVKTCLPPDIDGVPIEVVVTGDIVAT